MKLTRTGLRQLIKEELARVTEIDTTSEVDRAAQEISAKWQDEGQNLEGSGGRLNTLKFFLSRSQKFDPAEARRRTKMSTAMGDFVFNDFDEAGIPAAQHPELAEKILDLMTAESLTEGAAKPPDIEMYLNSHSIEAGLDYDVLGDGVSTDYWINAVDEDTAYDIARVMDPESGYEGNPLAGTRYRIDVQGTGVRWS